MADPLKLDLDTLAPESATVTLGGKDYTVHPPSVGNIVRLTKIAKAIDDLPAGGQLDPVAAMALIEQLVDVLEPVIPGIKSDDVSLNLAQAGALMRFVFSMAAPAEIAALKAEGIDPITEKKIPNAS